MDYIREIAEAMSANHAAVMIGAGFSKNADKLSSTDKWFKNWNELSDMFYETVYGNDGPGKEYNSSLRLAQEVEITVGRPKLENILKEAIPDEDYGPSEVYTKLMELPWRDVFTTNYDRVINIEISNIMPILRLLYALVVNNISTEYEKNVLFINLPRLMEKTAIRVEDFEKEARNKINCRVEICVIAREYYKSGERNNNLLEWRKLTENMDEFVEIRNIEFE